MPDACPPFEGAEAAPFGPRPVRAQLRALHAHWLGLFPGPGRLPSRRALDPAVLARAVRGILPHVWMVDVGPAPDRFTLRLVGTAIQDVGSGARPGADVAPFDPGGGIRADMAAAIAGRRPVFRRGGTLLGGERVADDLETLILPFAEDGHIVDLLLNCSLYTWPRARR